MWAIYVVALSSTVLYGAHELAAVVVTTEMAYLVWFMSLFCAPSEEEEIALQDAAGGRLRAQST